MPPGAFRPPWWLPDGHSQTLWRRLQPNPSLVRQRQRVELDDGDFIDVDFLPAVDRQQAHRRPLVFILHGLCGCSASPYVLSLQRHLATIGQDSLAMNMRGCSGEPNRLASAYHSGCSDDVEAVLAHWLAAMPLAQRRPLAVVGYSLGGNVLVKWLAETSLPVQAAVTVSNPFSLAYCCEQMINGRLSRFYGRHFVRLLLRSLAQKRQHFRAQGRHDQLAVLDDLGELGSIRHIRDFDARVTAPLHGFASAEDYYERCSSSRYVARVRAPLLVIHGRNDPIVPASGLPDPASLPAQVQLDLQPAGGHVGFLASGAPDWLERRIGRYLELTSA